jgi:hypothetical protein
MGGGLYETETFWQVFFVTGIIGGLTAWATGHALAETWRPFRQLFGYMLLLGAGVRFTHFALFDAHLLSLPSYLADLVYLLFVGGIAWRLTYARRIVTQYHWLYERTGPFTWRKRVPAAESSGNIVLKDDALSG